MVSWPFDLTDWKTPERSERNPGCKSQQFYVPSPEYLTFDFRKHGTSPFFAQGPQPNMLLQDHRPG